MRLYIRVDKEKRFGDVTSFYERKFNDSGLVTPETAVKRYIEDVLGIERAFKERDTVEFLVNVDNHNIYHYKVTHKPQPAYALQRL